MQIVKLSNPKRPKFAELLAEALAVKAVPFRAPDIARFIARRCKELGIENPAMGRQTVYNWMQGKRPDADGYAAMARILDVNTTWLIEGHGDMLRKVNLDPEESEIITIYRQLGAVSVAARDNWVSQGRSLLSLMAPKGAANPYGRK